MLVFIDESGDPGFEVAAGSSPIFALAMVIFDDHQEASRTQSLVAKTRVRLGVKPEFKFNKCRSDLRDRFFDAVTDCGFRVRAIVVKKDAIWSGRLRANAEAFYSFFLRTMMKFHEGTLSKAKIVIDGSGDQQFKRSLGSYVRRHATPKAVSSVRLKSSRAEPLLQLADMCVGAIARSYRTDERGTDRWRTRLASKIDDVWEFK